MNGAAATSTPPTSPTQAPLTSMAVMRPGDDLSPDLKNELARVVATTAQRERLRKRTLGVLGSVGGTASALAIFSGMTAAANLPLALFGILCIAPILPLGLAWGVRNRALLNVAAGEAGVDHAALARAVRAVEKGQAGPSAALQGALQKATADRPR